MKEYTAFIIKVKTSLWNVGNRQPCHSTQCDWPQSSRSMLLKLQVSHTVLGLFFVHFTCIFLLLSMSSAHFNYNIQSQIKQVVTVMMPFRSESTTSSTTQCAYNVNKCLFTGVTKTAKCKIRLWNLLMFSPSFCFTNDVQQQTWTVNDTLYTHTYIQGNGMLPCTLCNGTE
jgi:hypothetical protein